MPRIKRHHAGRPPGPSRVVCILSRPTPVVSSILTMVLPCSVRCPGPEDTMTLAPMTYILPTTAWAVLLEPIVHDAPPGAVIEVHTEAMQQLVVQTLQAAGRVDLTVILRPPAAG